MKTRRRIRKRTDHSGSTFDSFLEEQESREDVEAVATKRVLAWPLEQEMKRQQKTKQAMARDLRTSRSQLNRLLDPQNASISLDTMARAAKVLCKSLIIQIGDRKSAATEKRAKRAHRHGTSV